MPTDTIYGVAAKVSMTGGIQRLYNLKGRDKNKPLAICCSEISQISRYVLCIRMHVDICRMKVSS